MEQRGKLELGQSQYMGKRGHREPGALWALSEWRPGVPRAR